PLTVTISGVYTDPLAHPLPGVTLVFESVYNSAQTQLQTTVSTATGSDASYSISLVPNTYSVCEQSANRKKWLGNIQVFADSAPGTLNEYLTSFQPDQLCPGILAEMEEILQETKQAASDAGFTPRGPWANTVNYEKNDLVQYAGSQYLATTTVTGTEPPAAPWQLFVKAGDTGPANTLEIGKVETLPASSSATANITGIAPNQTLDLGIPQGAPGVSKIKTVDGVLPDENGNVDTGAYTPSNPPPIYIPGKGEPGALVFAIYGSATTHLYPGNTVSGSGLTYAGINDGPIPILTNSGVGAGTYRCCGYIAVSDGGTHSATLFQRIDTPQKVQSKLLKSGRIEITDCRYSSADGSMIDCLMLVNGEKFPLTLCESDYTEHVPAIFKNAKEGRYGTIAPYSKQN
ncbi:TPA: prophage tail fiber N-terminal domain-containing protein, partial [Citrobacter farmeri]|nr:prophage tail fiber N-terminal domain-containing protein [Citrobacter farmeri]